jgi:hypothetical protein
MNRTLGVAAEPTLSDYMNLMKRDVSLSINCVQIGTIQNYNAVTNTASVKINFLRQLANGDKIEYPVLEDCPVFILNGGGASITFPIAKGDQCIILFNDRNIDNWYLDGSIKEPRDNRVHSIADGMVLVGISDSAHAIVAPTQSACLNGGSNKVAIKNDNEDLKTLIADLLDWLLNLQIAVSGAAGVVNPAYTLGLTGPTGLIPRFESLLDEGNL